MKNNLAEQIDKYVKQIKDFGEKHYTRKIRFTFNEIRKIYNEKNKNIARNSR